MAPDIESQSRDIAKRLPPGERIAVLGSTTFWSPQGEAVAVALGELLAARPGVVLLTGGMSGVAAAVSRSFVVARNRLRIPPTIFHLLPCGMPPECVGGALAAGQTLEERREIIARVATCYVVIEGGPGTAHEARVAADQGARIVPVGVTRGVAGKLHEASEDTLLRARPEWATLNSKLATSAVLAQAIVSLCFDIEGEQSSTAVELVNSK